jgi:two-component system, NtrC family, response regulator AtoC
MNNVRSTPRILVAEDEVGVRNLIGLALKHHGCSADYVEDIAEATARLQHMGSAYSAVIVALDMHEHPAAVISEARRQQQPVPVIALVGEYYNNAENIRADEIVCKPINGEKLWKAVQNCLRVRQQDPPHSADIAGGMPELGGASSVWRTEMKSLIAHVAVSDAPVLVQGETGAGKEVLARQLHTLSPRCKKPFLKVNCAALPSELIESELFGYERGAFTGAFKTTPGKFEMADGGTILLDEIGDMDFRLQAKLLQVLQDGEFIRLGSSEPRKVDVRVMAATHCDLERAIAERRFREDLYYRLNIITLHVLPLRERKDEILPLVYHFMRKHATQATPPVEITAGLRDVLLTHDWPGNIRELENVIRKLLVLRRPDIVAEDIQMRARRRTPLNVPAVAAPLAKGPVVTLPKPVPEVREDLVRAAAVNGSAFYHSAHSAAPAYTRLNGNGNMREDFNSTGETMYRNGGVMPQPATADASDAFSVLERVDQARREAETEAILAALNATLWNRKRAAEALNIDYKALLYKMKKLGIAERATSVAI